MASRSRLPAPLRSARPAIAILVLGAIALATSVPGAGAREGDRRPGVRWIASDPHVPLALVRDGAIEPVGPNECASWRTTGQTFTAVDFWGAPVREHRLVASRFYDITRCYELSFSPETPRFTLLVRGERAAFTAPRSARREPTPAERESFRAFALLSERVFEVAPPAPIEPDPATAPPRPLDERIHFFDGVSDDMPDDPQTERFAVLEGRGLLIASVDASGRWRSRVVEADAGLDWPWGNDPYRVLGIFDLDADGYPEVIVRESDGPTWHDAIYSAPSATPPRAWHRVASSPGGGTL